MHTPVLLNEAIKLLEPKPGEFFIDGTVNGGGHGKAIIEKITPGGIFLGLDWDKEILENAKKKIIKGSLRKLILINDNYVRIPEILAEQNLPKADGLILDLGFSSYHLESERGFSFQKDGSLDMRYNPSVGKSASEILNSLSEKQLAEIFLEYGEEHAAGLIAKKIVSTRKGRPIKTVKDLTAIIESVIHRHGRLHPATRVFQALRIFVNREFENISEILSKLPECLKPGGRIAVISFHSLEDRVVKNSFKKLASEKKVEILAKKPIIPNRGEIKINPKSRSAKLRIARIIL